MKCAPPSELFSLCHAIATRGTGIPEARPLHTSYFSLPSLCNSVLSYDFPPTRSSRRDCVRVLSILHRARPSQVRKQICFSIRSRLSDALASGAIFLTRFLLWTLYKVSFIEFRNLRQLIGGESEDLYVHNSKLRLSSPAPVKVFCAVLRLTYVIDVGSAGWGDVGEVAASSDFLRGLLG